jgi:hypothetical protein
MLFNAREAGVSRETFVAALRAELSYTERARRTAYCSAAATLNPFTCSHYEGKTNYAKGLCPVTERLHFSDPITHDLMSPPRRRNDLDDIVSAFTKVWEDRAEVTKS